MKEIPLKNGMVAVVDDEDYERLAQYNWSAVEGRRGNWYAVRMFIERFPDGTRKNRCRQMQRDVLDPDMTIPRSMVGDHINHDTLDNRCSNLRLVNAHVSILNTRMRSNNSSGYRGVHYAKEMGMWRVRIRSNGIRYDGGFYATAEDAGRAYNRLAIEHHGEHAQLNDVA